MTAKEMNRLENILSRGPLSQYIQRIRSLWNAPGRRRGRQYETVLAKEPSVGVELNGCQFAENQFSAKRPITNNTLLFFI